jgi:hypothetical protein
LKSATQNETSNTIEICNTKLKPTTQLKSSATQNETQNTIEIFYNKKMGSAKQN